MAVKVKSMGEIIDKMWQGVGSLPVGNYYYPMTDKAVDRYVLCLAEVSNAHWLVVDILSYQDCPHIQKLEGISQHWELTVNQGEYCNWGDLTCYVHIKGKPRRLIRKKYRLIDLPAGKLNFWLSNDVLMWCSN